MIYILIMIIRFGEGIDIETVEFSSEEGCEVAKEVFLSEETEIGGSMISAHRKAICVAAL